jgi:hypothetical protein
MHVAFTFPQNAISLSFDSMSTVHEFLLFSKHGEGHADHEEAQAGDPGQLLSKTST